MSKDLFKLRRSRTLTIFAERCNNFEHTYFTGHTEKLPVGYSYLYRNRPQLLVACFRTNSIPTQYLFQGTGFTESSNAGYLAYALAKKVPFSRIPRQLQALTRKRAEKRNEARIRSIIALSSRYRSIRDSKFPIPRVILDQIIAEITSYALNQFKYLSVKLSDNYAVRNAYITSG